MALHTAYRMGIIHFRALFSLLRLLPAYRLFRRLRRANNGLRLGLKLWAPEGYPSDATGLKEAWDVMEQDLIGVDVGLEALVPNDEVEPEEAIQRYEFPSLDLFGNEYRLSVEYRPEIDFHVDDLESVLSEKLVDMEEDWFTPTMARHRMDSVSGGASASSTNPPSRRVATPTAIPSSTSSNPAPIPQRQGPASIGSFQSGVIPGSRGRQASSQKSPDPGTTERWSAIGQGLPFASTSSALPADIKVRLGFSTFCMCCSLLAELTYFGSRCDRSSTVRTLDPPLHLLVAVHILPANFPFDDGAARSEPDIHLATDDRAFRIGRTH